MQQPSIPKGTRDFSPAEMTKRDYIFETIKNIFKLYGYQSIETPAMENLNTLLGKYGDEGDKLLFKILNSGNFLSSVKPEELAEANPNTVATEICKKGLRYDLTVPFARFVVQHRNEITFPFKRYQIQPVWRADRPQKGRYQEFYQCDVDVVGSNSLLNELELIHIINDVFNKLGVSVTIKLNNRKILAGIAEYIEEPGKLTEITIAIDKIDKIGLDKVNEELRGKGLSDSAINKLQNILKLKGPDQELLDALEKHIASSEIGMKGIKEVKEIFAFLKLSPINTKIELDLTLARGLNYYTGAIFEVKSNDVNIGSICGGGRYDDLTGIFGLKDVSGVGVSFGADRIYDVLNELNLYPKETIKTTQLLLINFGIKEQDYCLGIINKFRSAGISTELFPSSDKLKKQMSYANNKGIPYVLLIGEEEMASGQLTLKNMSSGEQEKMDIQLIIDKLNA